MAGKGWFGNEMVGAGVRFGGVGNGEGDFGQGEKFQVSTMVMGTASPPTTL